ncbi:MAG: RNA polymerase sigma-70 factor, ECF subfamily [Parcubacteria group bacterium Licking1014_17]|nr:MAG: RNA polymerase sigma-70 factor, ECF subfamily [Parcubacteria group bacterium Licking1014_17]
MAKFSDFSIISFILMDTNDEKSITEKINLAKKGDKKAFGELYNLFLMPVYRYVFLRVGNKDAAEDLTQIVFIKALKSIRDYENRGTSPLAYLFTIARNAIIDEYRKKKPESIDESKDIPDTENATERLSERNDSIRTLKKALVYLPIEQQELVILRFIADLSYKELNELTGRSEQALRQALSRTLKKLRYIIKHGDK